MVLLYHVKFTGEAQTWKDICECLRPGCHFISLSGILVKNVIVRQAGLSLGLGDPWVTHGLGWVQGARPMHGSVRGSKTAHHRPMHGSR